MQTTFRRNRAPRTLAVGVSLGFAVITSAAAAAADPAPSGGTGQTSASVPAQNQPPAYTPQPVTPPPSASGWQAPTQTWNTYTARPQQQYPRQTWGTPAQPATPAPPQATPLNTLATPTSTNAPTPSSTKKPSPTSVPWSASAGAQIPVGASSKGGGHNGLLYTIIGAIAALVVGAIALVVHEYRAR